MRKSASRGGRAQRDWLLAWTAGPGLLTLAALFLLPMLLVASFSVLEGTPNGGVRATLTLANYRRAFDPLYLSVLARSASLALLTTALSLALAYPASWAIRAGPEQRKILLG